MSSGGNLAIGCQEMVRLAKELREEMGRNHADVPQDSRSIIKKLCVGTKGMHAGKAGGSQNS